MLLLCDCFYDFDKTHNYMFSFVFHNKEKLIGFGCAFAWISVAYYIEYDKKHIIFSSLMNKIIKQ